MERRGGNHPHLSPLPQGLLRGCLGPCDYPKLRRSKSNARGIANLPRPSTTALIGQSPLDFCGPVMDSTTTVTLRTSGAKSWVNSYFPSISGMMLFSDSISCTSTARIRRERRLFLPEGAEYFEAAFIRGCFEGVSRPVFDVGGTPAYDVLYQEAPPAHLLLLYNVEALVAQ